MGIDLDQAASVLRVSNRFGGLWYNHRDGYEVIREIHELMGNPPSPSPSDQLATTSTEASLVSGSCEIIHLD